MAIGELDDEDRTSLRNVIDAFVTKSRVKALAGGVTGPGRAESAPES